jgi:hypothetical protein
MRSNFAVMIRSARQAGQFRRGFIRNLASLSSECKDTNSASGLDRHDDGDHSCKQQHAC